MKYDHLILVFAIAVFLTSALGAANPCDITQEQPPSALSELREDQTDQAAASLGLKYGVRFTSSSQLDSNDPLIALLKPSPDSTLFISHASYQEPIDASRLDASFFQDMKMTSYLFGPQYRLTPISQSPFMFTGIRNVDAGIMSARVTSQSALQVFDYNTIPSNYSALVRRVVGRNAAPVRVIVQTLDGFGKYFRKAFALTLIYPNEKGRGSRIEFFTGSDMIGSDCAGICGFFEDHAIRTIARQDLVGYAVRLSRVGNP